MPRSSSRQGGKALTLLLLPVVLALGALFLLMPPLLVLLPGSYLLCYIPVVGKIFAKYIPQPEQEEAPAQA